MSTSSRWMPCDGSPSTWVPPVLVVALAVVAGLPRAFPTSSLSWTRRSRTATSDACLAVSVGDGWHQLHSLAVITFYDCVVVRGAGGKESFIPWSKRVLVVMRLYRKHRQTVARHFAYTSVQPPPARPATPADPAVALAGSRRYGAVVNSRAWVIGPAHSPGVPGEWRMGAPKATAAAEKQANRSCAWWVPFFTNHFSTSIRSLHYGYVLRSHVVQ
jgi:hypothetical protein